MFSLVEDQGGGWIEKKNPPEVDFGCKLGWEIDFRRFRVGRIKFELDEQRLKDAHWSFMSKKRREKKKNTISVNFYFSATKPSEIDIPLIYIQNRPRVFLLQSCHPLVVDFFTTT